jgi:hypothetical protein
VPFTPSHIAAALPFVRTPLPVAPLVIGTMAPDVPYYVPLGIPRDLTHSALGVPTVDLVITAVLVLLWYAALRAPIVDLAPAAVRQRVGSAGLLGWRDRDRSWPAAVGLGVAAALIGILTHLVWDAFTHRSSALVQAVPALHANLGPLPVSSWLQHASTVVGLAAIAVWTWFWMRRTARSETPGRAAPQARIAAWTAVILAFGVAGFIAWSRGIGLGLAPLEPSLVFLGATVAGGAAGLTGVVICALWWIARAFEASRRA